MFAASPRCPRLQLKSASCMQYSLDLDITLEDSVSSTFRLVQIEVDTHFGADAVDDEGVAGIYRAQVPASLCDSMAAACALGAFHSTFVVNWLESFRFAVYDFGSEQPLEPDKHVDWTELGKLCFDIEYLGTRE